MASEPERAAAASPRALNGAIALLSAAALAYQIALMRVFSIAQWHHCAYMIISIAMLGFGASGTVLSLARPRLAGREQGLLRFGALASALGFAGGYALSQHVPFETMELLNQPGQFWWLLALYAFLAVPFFLVASCITLAFLLQPDAIGRVYFFNMAGSGMGALGTMALLYAVSPARIPALVAVVALVAWLLLGPWRAGRMWPLAFSLAGLVAMAAWHTPVRVSQYKGLSYALQLPDARIVEVADSPLSEITAVSSAFLRETPGQLSNYPMSQLGELPPQIGLYFDAGPVSPVQKFDGALEPFAFLDYVTGALPYRLVEHPRALVIGPGGGSEVLNALVHRAAHVTAVETDPGVVGLLRGPLGAFSGGWMERPDVSAVLAEGRGYLEATAGRYDVIVLPAAGSATSAAAGVLALNESYLYTTEALALFIDRLTPNGVLAMNCWLQLPPRQGVKLFATAVEACERAGIADPARHIAFVRSWNTGTIVVARAPLDESRVAAVRRFCTERFFDPCYYPGMGGAEANTYTQLERPYYYSAARALLFGDREGFYRDYEYYVRPATDDRPYFFRFLRWRDLRRLWEGGVQGVPFVEWGYLSLMATLVQSMLAGAVLILLPLAYLSCRRAPASAGKGAVLFYFACLGFGYMFLEIAFIQVFMRFLAYPIYAVSVVLTAFLAFSGCGSLWAGALETARRTRAVWAAVGLVTVLSIAYLLCLPPIFRAAAGWPDLVKIPGSVLLLAPLAFSMGVPFPAGLQWLSDRASGLLPWAWAVNGCASVIGATLATFFAVHLGFRAAVLAAVALYAAAAWGMAVMHSRLSGNQGDVVRGHGTGRMP